MSIAVRVCRRIRHWIATRNADDFDKTPLEKNLEKHDRWLRRFFGWSVTCGAVAIILFAVGTTFLESASGHPLSPSPYNVEDQWFGRLVSLVGLGVLVAMSSMAPTALLGFLFGLERRPSSTAPESTSHQSQSPSSSGANARPSSASSPSLPVVAHKSTTNLEQISDWLTKILLGAGLTQIDGAIRSFDRAGNAAAAAGFALQSGATISAIPAQCVMLYFGSVAFVWGYLLTRMSVPIALDAVELASAAFKVPVSAAKSLSEMKFIGGYGKKLTESALGPRPTPEQLEAAIRIRATPLAELAGINELIAVARANTIGSDKNRSKAIDAYRLAIMKSPASIALYRELAYQYWRKKNSSLAAITMCQGAHKAEEIGDKANYVKLLSEGIYYSLYSSPPRGYERALAWLIELGEETVAGDDQLLIYRICANGQKFKAVTGEVKDNQEKRELLNAISRDIRSVLALDNTWRKFIVSIWDPKESRDDARDNDLFSLFEDETAREDLAAVLRPESAI